MCQDQFKQNDPTPDIMQRSNLDSKLSEYLKAMLSLIKGQGQTSPLILKVRDCEIWKQLGLPPPPSPHIVAIQPQIQAAVNMALGYQMELGWDKFLRGNHIILLEIGTKNTLHTLPT